jgi:competence protein ComEA
VNFDYVKKITFKDLIIVLGLALIVTGLGIKMKLGEEALEENSFGIMEKKEKALEVVVNINIASAMELEVLPAIGPVTAQKIIDYRNVRGVFKSKEEIMEVSGIGVKTYEKIKDKIKI